MNRERALTIANVELEATTNQVQQTSAPSPIANPDLRLATLTAAGTNITLGPFIDTELLNDASLFRSSADCYNLRSVLDINAHANAMRQRRFDAQILWTQIPSVGDMLMLPSSSSSSSRAVLVSMSPSGSISMPGFTKLSLPKRRESFTSTALSQSMLVLRVA